MKTTGQTILCNNNKAFCPKQVGILVETLEPDFLIFFFNFIEHKQKNMRHSSFPALPVG
jgi:hypothetical protein